MYLLDGRDIGVVEKLGEKDPPQLAPQAQIPMSLLRNLSKKFDTRQICNEE